MVGYDLSLITINISDCRQFSHIYISQGNVATYLRCDGIFKYNFVVNLPVSPPVEVLSKSVNIWGSYGQEFSVRQSPSRPLIILHLSVNWFSVFFHFQLLNICHYRSSLYTAC